jgi:hypothetical protein
MAESRVLIGRQAIQEYLGVSRSRFMSLVAGGLPAAKRVIGGREYWLSDKDLLDYWFKGLIVGADLAPGVVFNKWQSSFDAGAEVSGGRQYRSI